jgi:Ohr subfamily peroxiredoxin
MNKLEKILYTAHTHATGGRDGKSTSDDGLLNVNLALPKAMGGSGNATNPEQLFAAGYSACFIGALRHVAGLKKWKFQMVLQLMQALILAQSHKDLVLL